ncbi:uncharacterized protein LOC105664392 isoform X1 [Megachile rotundata]|uniref:uncharacterized protein LOC105664392 isoform X1 n=1 Tax=Megachile rotundata TaxID=143995 RepID=UPI003FD04EB8
MDPKVNRVRQSLFSGAGRRWQSIRRKTANRVGILAGLVAGCGIVLHYLDRSVAAFEQDIEIPRFPWAFNKPFKSFDHATLRRGWVVYRTVCHTCHSLRYIRFMDLVETTHTREEAKAIAAEFEVQDGPDEVGNYYTRPAKLLDYIPSPYPNEEAARAANFGAYPPDLTQMVHARKYGLDYCFSLLTGFMDPPAGVELNEGQYFNIYFPGGFTTMPQVHKFRAGSSVAKTCLYVRFVLAAVQRHGGVRRRHAGERVANGEGRGGIFEVDRGPGARREQGDVDQRAGYLSADDGVGVPRVQTLLVDHKKSADRLRAAHEIRLDGPALAGEGRHAIADSELTFYNVVVLWKEKASERLAYRFCGRGAIVGPSG